MWIFIMALLVGGGVIVFRSCVTAPVDLVSKAGNALSTIAASLKRGTITTAFISYATTISNYQRLQITTLKQTEIFNSSEDTIIFKYFPRNVEVEARAPVEYTYYLDLNDKWRFELKDNVLYVFPPAIKFNTPAVDASALNFEVKKGTFLANKEEAIERLKKSITVRLRDKARDNVPLVRENARRQIEEFVQNWLARSFSDGQNHPIKVVFPDEKKREEISIKPSKG